MTLFAMGAKSTSMAKVWLYNHSEGKTVRGMSVISAAASGSGRTFPLNMDTEPAIQKDQYSESCHGGIGFHMSKITMQMDVIRKAITAGLKFSIAFFDFWYSAARHTNFLEPLGKSRISKAKSVGALVE